ncbi:MAG TPA: Hpt domain-containing protein [Oligoflexia bacterium]|nr:Hpt domain-containing protein [Oligoflexia bacterium]
MNEIELLRQQYLAELQNKATTLGNLLQSILHDLGCKRAPNWKELEFMVHKFAGSSGTYGFGALSRVLSHLENALLSGALPRLKKNWAARYLQAWQQAFTLSVKNAISEKKSPAALDNDLEELSQLLNAKEAA